jgi:hypothetical protein
MVSRIARLTIDEQRSGADVSYIVDGPKYTKLGNELIAQGKLKSSPVAVMPKGLASVAEAFSDLKGGKASDSNKFSQRGSDSKPADQRAEGRLSYCRHPRPRVNNGVLCRREVSTMQRSCAITDLER